MPTLGREHSAGGIGVLHRTAVLPCTLRPISQRYEIENRGAGMGEWLQNDGLFAAELARGHQFAELVASRLRSADLTARATPMELRDDVRNRERFTISDVDVVVERNGVPVVLEIKSRRIRFSGPDDWPAAHDPAMIDTVSGWLAKAHRPVAVVLISQVTRAIAVVPVSTAAYWRVVRTHDRRRNIPTVSYACPRAQLRSFSELVAWLKEEK